ncbi:MAG: hypothetical protein AAGF12_11035 [Myxococcota bacterium]
MCSILGCRPVDDAGTPDGCTPSTETCDGTDEDCDGMADEGLSGCQTCTPGTGDCDGDPANGCEANLYSAVTCGRCDRACDGAASLCVNEGNDARCEARCPSGSPLMCGAACVDPNTDLANCGGCDQPCGAPRLPGTCAGGTCTLGSCEAGWGDCDDDLGNGCETPLDTVINCGSCGMACDGAAACEGMPSCARGMCEYAVASAGTMCRAASCAGDLPEQCDGAMTSCPAACGCAGEPCCAGDACATDLVCRSGQCRACTTTSPTTSGTAGTFGMTFFNGVSAGGTTLTFTALNGSTATVTLGGGATASGSFTATNSGYLNAVMSSGNQLLFFDRDGAMGAITFTGATLSGGGTSPLIPFMGGGIPGLIVQIRGGGNTLLFFDSLMNQFATVTLSGVEVCP